MTDCLTHIKISWILIARQYANKAPFMASFGSISRIQSAAGPFRDCGAKWIVRVAVELSGTRQFGAPGKHAEALLVGMLSKQGLRARPIALADRLHNGVVTAMSPEQQIECA
jgi:hypothetical protein